MPRTLLLVAALLAQDPTVERIANDGVAAFQRGDLARAGSLFREALALQEQAKREDVLTADVLSNLGIILFRQGDVTGAQALHERAVRILEAQAPQSSDLGVALSNLAQVLRERGDLEGAQALHERRVSLAQDRSPDSPELAMAWGNLAYVARDRGSFDQAEAYLRRVLAISEKTGTEDRALVFAFNGLGAVALDRGHLDEAGSWYRRAVALSTRLAPKSQDTASALGFLARVDLRRGDLDAAEDHLRQALDLHQQIAPDSLIAAGALTSLAAVEFSRGNLDGAESGYRRALAIRQKQVPDSLQVAASRALLGALMLARGDAGAAEAELRQAVTLTERLAPQSLTLAVRLTDLAEAVLALGKLEEAQDLFGRSLVMHERLALGTIEEARTRHGLGQTQRRRGQAREAAESLGRAVDALEAQIGRLGGSREDAALFRAGREAYYQDLVEVLVELERPEPAFQVLERSRARSFLDMLAVREAEISEAIPEAAEAKRRQLGWRYDRLQEDLAQREARGNAEAAARLRRQLEEIRREHVGLLEDSRRGAVSSAASLHYPQPLDAEAARAVLDPGTLVLAYSVGRDRTELFTLDRDEGLRVETLPLGEEALRQEVELFRRLAQESKVSSPRQRQMIAVGRRLFDALVAPVAGRVARSARLLVIPDGPLHVLPFAALVRDLAGGPRGARPHYLVEWKPIHVVLSCTVYGEIRRRHPAPGAPAPLPVELVAFGDPAVSERRLAEASEGRERSVLRDLGELGPLPDARTEVRGIAAQFPRTQVFVGPEATEERIKALRGPIGYLHFATHALLDRRSPLDSALVLSIPEKAVEGRENGLLQAWEILSQLRFDVDLVGLSACDSGLGGELRGEGLIGLTRAFQYAGARTVAASLWHVADQATPALMTAFYRSLRAGRAKDEALRAAQVGFIRHPVRLPAARGGAVERDLSLPYYWAAFQLYGDWR